ncbi:MAG: polysaccharide pyruvyl transferase CsaB [Clostridia bacterium]|nr:polysaccharide pyruvyl transferase CsaB [Clostridia bacterium]
MKVLHLIGGGDVGGAKSHVLSLVKELGKHIDVKLVSFRPGPFADDAKAMGINVEVVKTGNFIKDLKRVLEIINTEGYEILHSHGAKANMFSVIVKRFLRLATVTTVHSDYRLDYLQSILKRVSFGVINTIALRFIDYYIGVSKNFKEMLVKRNFDPELIFTVYNGIDFDTPIENYSRSEFLKKYNLNDIKEDDVIVGILARLDPVKGLGVYLNAAKIVLKHNPSVKFLIGGDGKEKKSLEKKAAALGIKDSVYFLGFVNEPYNFMNCLDINLLTSLSESFPYVILEGARLRKATISSNVGGISDLIESGENGYLFNPGDYKTLAEHIIRLVDDKTLRVDLGEKIYQKAYAQFSLRNMCNTQLDIYRTISERGVIKVHLASKYDAIISGYFGFNNIGDDAMLLAIINNLRKHKKDMKILVLSKSPQQTQAAYNVDSIYRFNILHLLYIMSNSKLFINGGGSLIQDNTSTRSVFYYLLMIWLAKKLGMKVMIYANGIGPLNRESNRKLTKFVLNQVDVITLREEMSKKEVDTLNINKPRVLITADPAMAIDSIDNSEIDTILAKEGIEQSGPFVGFSVRKWNDQEKYEQVIAKAADYVIERYHAQPVFIPMHYPHDLTVINNIVSRMKGKGYVIRSSYDGRQVLGIIKRMDLLIGMRLHALIFAASAEVPIIGLAYDQKVEGFLEYINLTSQSSAGHVKDLNFDHLKELIDDMWGKRQEVRTHLKNITSVLKEKTQQDTKIAVELMEEK